MRGMCVVVDRMQRILGGVRGVVEGKGEVKEFGLLRKECRQSENSVDLVLVVRVRDLNKRLRAALPFPGCRWEMYPSTW